MPSRALRSRIFFGMGAVAILSPLAMVLGVVPAIEQSVERSVVDRLSNAGRSVESFLEERKGLLRSMVRSAVASAELRDLLLARSPDADSLGSHASRARRIHAVDLVMLADGSGKIVASEPDRAMLGEAAVDHDFIEGSLRGARFTGLADVGDCVHLVSSAPVVDAGRLIGIAVVGARLDGGFARDLRRASGADVIFARDRTALSWSVAEVSDGEAARIARRVAENSATGVDVQRVTAAGLDRFSIAPSLGSGVTVILSRSAGMLTTLEQQLWNWMLWIGVAAAGVAMVISHFISRRLSLPLRDLMAAADRVAAGDLGVEVNESSTEETARLGESFNRMTQQVRQLVDDVRAKAEVLRQQRNELEWANQTKSNFLVSASHELRTPITGIISAVEILCEHGGDHDEETRREFLGMIDSEAARISELVDQLLDVTNLDSGHIQMDFDSFDLGALVAELYENFKAGPGATRTTTLKVSGRVDDCVGDARRITQAVGQLLDNVDRFTPPDSPVALHLRELEGAVELRIADRGPGLSPEGRERVFERFVQGGDILTEKPAGVGLGLSIAREIARAHAGDLVCEENPGGGCVFVLRWPKRIRVGSSSGLDSAATTG